MTIFVYRTLTKAPEIGNIPVWVLPSIWRLEQIMDTKLDTKVGDKILLNDVKYKDYIFYLFWVIKGKPTGCKITPLPPTPYPQTQISVNRH